MKDLLFPVDGSEAKIFAKVSTHKDIGTCSYYNAKKKGTHVVASDLSNCALQCIKENATINNANIKVIKSDLFDEINPADFDIILINPPYYPKQIISENDMPWFCGEHFEYFEKLFHQLKRQASKLEVLMILSEDCSLTQIQAIAQKNALRLIEIYSAKRFGEWNFIYQISD